MADANGPGWVCVMTYTHPDTETKYYKIGRTSRDPEKRLKEVESGERQHTENVNIIMTLVGFTHANQMRDAQTAAQEAVVNILVIDPERQQPHDWFIEKPDGTSPDEDIILQTVGAALEGDGRLYGKRNLDNGWSCYTKVIIEQEEQQIMNVSAGAVEHANSSTPTEYVYVLSVPGPNDVTRYTFGCTVGDPDEHVQEIRRDLGNNAIELVCFMNVKNKDKALREVNDAFENLGFTEGPARSLYRQNGE